MLSKKLLKCKAVQAAIAHISPAHCDGDIDDYIEMITDIAEDAYEACTNPNYANEPFHNSKRYRDAIKSVFG